MKKRVVVAIVIVVILLLGAVFLFLNSAKTFNEEDLQGTYIQNIGFSIYGDWLFYSERGIVFSHLKARNLKTGEVVSLNTGGANEMFVYKEYVIYTACLSFDTSKYLYKKNLNGFFNQNVTSDRIADAHVDKNYVYYTKASYVGDSDFYELRHLYRINLDTDEKVKLLSEKVKRFAVVNGDIYYAVDSGLKKLSKDGKTKDIIEGNVNMLTVSNGYIYAIINNYLYKISVLDEDIELIINNMVESFRVADDYIYCLTEEGILKVSKSGLTTERIVGGNVKYLTICEQNLCYILEEFSENIFVLDTETGNIKNFSVPGIDSPFAFLLHDNRMYYKDNNKKLHIVT